MPYMHLDLSRAYATAVKRDLATRLCNLYAEVMQTRSWPPNVGRDHRILNTRKRHTVTLENKIERL